MHFNQKNAYSFRGNGNANKIRWISFKEAVKENLTIKKPFFLWFHETGCEYCILFKKNVLSKTKITNRINKYFYPVKINAYGNKKYEFFNGKVYSGGSLSSKFNVIGFPTSIFFDADFKRIFTLPGYWSENDFAKVIGWIGKGLYKKESIRRYFKNNS